MEKLEHLSIADGNVKCCSDFGKQSGCSLKRLNIELLYDPAIPLLCIHPREIKIYVHTKTCTQVFLAAFFIIVKRWKQPNCLSTNECSIPLQQNIIHQ